MDNPLWSPFRFLGGRDNIPGLLACIPAFDGFLKNELRIVEQMLHQRQYKKGETVFNEGEPGAGMYIVKSGEVEITRKMGNGAELALALVKEQGFFGELALLDEIPRSASARAVADTVLFAFSKPSLESLCRRNPRLGIKILSNLSRVICKRLVKSNDAMEQLQDRLGKQDGEDKSQESLTTHV
ncbi:MAG TPA: cyclic nucleotide-binding domain-containing protein [Chitinivibrionales bacterium]|nr:cyclic nucleotide-binding domain-containing protein [Chitinivibrionales bacterium]